MTENTTVTLTETQARVLRDVLAAVTETCHHSDGVAAFCGWSFSGSDEEHEDETYDNALAQVRALLGNA